MGFMRCKKHIQAAKEAVEQAREAVSSAHERGYHRGYRDARREFGDELAVLRAEITDMTERAASAPGPDDAVVPRLHGHALVDLRGLVGREVHRGMDVVISGAEYLHKSRLANRAEALEAAPSLARAHVRDSVTSDVVCVNRAELRDFIARVAEAARSADTLIYAIDGEGSCDDC